MDKLTTKFQSALADAQSLALGSDQQFVEPVHVMIALISQDGGSIKPLLVQAGVDVTAFKSRLDQVLTRLPKVEGTGGDLQVSSALLKILNLTDKLAQKRADQFISSELFVLAVMQDGGEIAAELKKLGLKIDSLERAIESVRGGQSVNDASAEDQRGALSKYTIDLTERAEQGKLDPVIGRDDEIEELFKCFSGVPKTILSLLVSRVSARRR
jgi:ATP-dependent Clp protease ATP-binding subunit ClpB